VKDDKTQGSETQISDHQASSFVIILIDLPGSSLVQNPQKKFFKNYFSSILTKLKCKTEL
jgi:hypothetical protein